MDRILAAQRLTVADLLPSTAMARLAKDDETGGAVPVVPHAVALFEPVIRPSAVEMVLQLPVAALQAVRARASNARRAWERFVAIRVPMADSLPMEPLVLPDAIVLIDRHYNSLQPYRPNRPNLYAVRQGAHLTLRYSEFLSSRLVLRPLSAAFPLSLIEVEPGESVNDLLTGRIVFILNGL